jgi:multimeric flavodoxin WrbA
MKVIAFNGSARKDGNTAIMIKRVPVINALKLKTSVAL